MSYSGILEPYRNIVEAPAGVEIAIQEKKEKQYLFVLNYEREEAGIFLKKKARLLYTGEVQEGSVVLPAFGTAVYEILP